MKRRKLLKYLHAHACTFLREGSRHTIYINPVQNLSTAVPRHPEIDAVIVRKICKDLDIPVPSEK